MEQDTKTIYAQSSDIKSRTYLEYRRDMKQKAIAELEILPWLKEKIHLTDKNATVEKFGGDKSIWFLRKGGITRAPDFVIRHAGGEQKYVEFQYAKETLTAYDFKISKIAMKSRTSRQRVPKSDTLILYVVKPVSEYALLEPAWIFKNSRETVAAAWGNAPVYRVAQEKIKGKLKKDKALANVCRTIDKKIALLDFQHQAIDAEKEKLSYLLQQVIDEKQILSIMPQTLDSFFKICFILSNIDKTPLNAPLWLIYLLTFINHKMNSYALFQLVYSLDFLYPRIELKPNEVRQLIAGQGQIQKQINKFAKDDGSYQSDKRLPPLEDTRYSLFVLNIPEDLTQDLLFYYGENVNMPPIRKIYQSVKNADRTHAFISSGV